MGRYSKAFSIKKQFQSPNCQTCQGQSHTLKKIIFLELFLRITEVEKWNLFEKLGQLRTPTVYGYFFGRLSVLKYMDKGVIVIKQEETPSFVPPPGLALQ